MANLGNLIVRGVTRILGDAYANKFIGNLQGNADTATSAIKASTADSAASATSANKASIATSVQDYGTSSYREIKIGYSGNGLSSSTITSAIGFTDSGTKIKNISKDEFRNWLATASGTWNISISGNASTAPKATLDENGKVIADTYLPLTGGTLSGSGAELLKLDSSNSSYNAILFKIGGVSKSEFGFTVGKCSYMYDYTSSKYLGIDVSGTPFYGAINGTGKYTLIHSGNIGSQVVKGLSMNFVNNLDNAAIGELFSSDFKAANRPSTNYATGITICNNQLKYNYQLAFSSNAEVFVRYKDSSAWQSWKQIAFTDSNVASASKWANARTITLTGSVTGSVSLDGSQNVSLATTTNHTHNYLPLSGGTLTGSLQIGASDNTAYNDMVLVRQGKYIRVNCHGTEGNIDYGTYDSGGTKTSEQSLRFSLSGLSLVSNGAVVSTILHSGNYNSYAPKLDGTGATGTWGINISGNAASASNASAVNGISLTWDGEVTSSQWIAAWESGTSIRRMSAYNTFISMCSYLDEGSSDVTDGTMFITSYATDNGFADPNGKNKPYKRKASLLWNYINNKCSSIYATTSWVNDNFYTYSESDSRYIQSETDPVWTAAKGNYYTKTECNNRYIQSEADPVWTAAKGNYYTKTECDNKFQPKGTYLTEQNLQGYATQEWVRGEEYLYRSGGTMDARAEIGITTKLFIGNSTSSDTCYTKFNCILHGGGDESNPNWIIRDNGNSEFKSSVSANAFYASSDIRLKNILDDINIDFDKLKLIPKKYYTWKGSDILQLGTIAQDIQKIYPEVVSKNENGYLSVDYSKLSIIALAAIDKLNERIKELECQIKL